MHDNGLIAILGIPCVFALCLWLWAFTDSVAACRALCADRDGESVEAGYESCLCVKDDEPFAVKRKKVAVPHG